MPSNDLTPACIHWLQGIPYSPHFADRYHSQAGGVEQCLQVFLYGNDLPRRWQQETPFQVLETGFGIGLNFLVTWQQWQRRSTRSCPALHYVALEKYPPTRAVLSQMLAAYPALQTQAQALLMRWPTLVSGIHRIDFEKDQVHLTLVFGDIRQTLPELSLAADAIFLDGFAPAKNPEMWSTSVLQQIARQCRWGATLATWCVAGSVRRALEYYGFSTERHPGFGGKRQRLQARFDKIPLPAFQQRCTLRLNPILHRTLHQPRPLRHALIIGAGLAGCLTSEALVQRGWRVQLLEQRAGPACEASGNPAGILRPTLSRDDNAYSRLSRAGFLSALQALQRLSAHLPPGAHGATGVLLAARSEAEAWRLQDCARRFVCAPDFVEIRQPGIQADLGDVDLPWGGLFFPGAGWVSPPLFCQAALAACGQNLQSQWQVRVQRLLKVRHGWQAWDDAGHLLAEAPVAVLAVGALGLEWTPLAPWSLQKVGGQITVLEPDPFPPGTPVLCQEGYLIPGTAEGLCVGATYEQEPQWWTEQQGMEQNLLRLQRWQRKPLDGSSILKNRRGVRAVSRDRMPLMGPVTGQEGLYALLGMGSHGLLWCSLGAQLIGAWLEHEPLPLSRSMLEAVSPARFNSQPP